MTNVPEIHTPLLWPDGSESLARPGDPWLQAAHRAGQFIPTACGSGSCGACEIEVNGRVVRACIAAVPAVRGRLLRVEFCGDPHW